MPKKKAAAAAAATPSRAHTPDKVGDLAAAPYNPRTITDAELGALRKAMDTLGDLSGIIFNRRTGQLVGGHQRVKSIPGDAEIVILERFEPPTDRGTVSVGYVEYAGERWLYREVDVDLHTEQTMNIAANKHGGHFDDVLLSAVLADLDAVGVDADLLGMTSAELDDLLSRGAAFEPQGEEPGRLDQKEPITCPACGHEFEPN